MDFPFGNYLYVDPEGEVISDASNAERILPMTSITVVPPKLTTASETTFNPALQTELSPQTGQTNSAQTQAQVYAQARTLGRSSNETEQLDPLTWNSALNSILQNEAVDPAIRARIRERVQRNSTTVAPGLEDAHPVTMVDVGLVPNFSYPVAGSEFLDRLHVRESEEHQQEHLLPNGVSPGHQSHSSSNDSFFRSSTPIHLPLRGGNDERRTQLTNGVPPGYYPPSSSFSDDSSNDPRHHPPSPPDRVPEQVFVLLCSLLTPSELALHYDVIQDSAPPHPPPFPDLVPPSNATSTTPVDVRLVQKLHTAVHGLQDRAVGVEEDLIPQLSTHLEQKHLQISELDRENLSLHGEIRELKRIVDFSSKVLAGCWEREWAVWRTLVDIQRQREAYRGPLACIFARAATTNTRDNELLDYHRPEGYVAQPLRRSGRAAQGPLKKKELDALLLMAKQNVGILIEDLEEMKGLVIAFQERNRVEEEEMLPVEGS
jgi:hypothetical protein